MLLTSPRGEVSSGGQANGRYNINLHFPKVKPEKDFELTITPLLAPLPSEVQTEVTFSGLTLLQLSQFFTLKVKQAGESITRVIKIPLANMPTREQAVVQSVVKDTEAFFGYLAFILGDDYLLTALENKFTQKSSLVSRNSQATLPALYERLLRTAATSPEKLKELDYVLEMVDQDEVIPDGFMELYNTFRKAVKL